MAITKNNLKAEIDNFENRLAQTFYESGWY